MNTAPKPDGWSINGHRFDGIRFHDDCQHDSNYIEVFFNQEEDDAILAEIHANLEGVTLFHRSRFSEQERKDIMLLALIVARVSNPAGEIAC